MKLLDSRVVTAICHYFNIPRQKLFFNQGQIDRLTDLRNDSSALWKASARANASSSFHFKLSLTPLLKIGGVYFWHAEPSHVGTQARARKDSGPQIFHLPTLEPPFALFLWRFDHDLSFFHSTRRLKNILRLSILVPQLLSSQPELSIHPTNTSSHHA